MEFCRRRFGLLALVPLILVSAPAAALGRELQDAVGANWFYGLDLLGTLAFGIAGFIRAVEEDYDLGGMFILTALPAVGGGTLRDVLVGGERLPPFVFADPVYLYIVLAIVLLGAPIARAWPQVGKPNSFFSEFMFISDAIGLSAFAVIGATVAIVAGLHWFWVPILAAMTCAGGGILLDICTGRPPRVLREDHYEELAAAGGLLYLGLVKLSVWFSDRFPEFGLASLIVLSVLVTLLTVFVSRVGLVRFGWAKPFQRATA